MKKIISFCFLALMILTVFIMSACKANKKTSDVSDNPDTSVYPTTEQTPSQSTKDDTALYPATEQIPSEGTEDDEAVYNGLFAYKAEGDVIKIVEQKSLIYKPEETEIVIPEEIDGLPVTVIGECAFYQYKNARSFVLPQTLKKIEGAAFYRCYSLQSIFIPQQVDLIEGDAFFRCSSLSKIEVDAENKYYCSVDGVLFNKDKTVLHTYPEGKTDEKYSIPSSVTELSGTAFGYRCAHLKEIVIGKNVTVFPDYNVFVYPDDVVLLVEPNSAAEEYAKTHELNYRTE